MELPGPSLACFGAKIKDLEEKTLIRIVKEKNRMEVRLFKRKSLKDGDDGRKD